MSVCILLCGSFFGKRQYFCLTRVAFAPSLGHVQRRRHFFYTKFSWVHSRPCWKPYALPREDDLAIDFIGNSLDSSGMPKGICSLPVKVSKSTQEWPQAFPPNLPNFGSSTLSTIATIKASDSKAKRFMGCFNRNLNLGGTMLDKVINSHHSLTANNTAP